MGIGRGGPLLDTILTVAGPILRYKRTSHYVRTIYVIGKLFTNNLKYSSFIRQNGQNNKTPQK